jgi:hypothetical protein
MEKWLWRNAAALLQLEEAGGTSSNRAAVDPSS